MESSRRTFLRLTTVGAAGLVPGASSLVPGASAWNSILGGQSDPAKHAFLAAVRAGNMDEVARRLQAAPALLQATDETGRSAYALAHLAGHRDVGDLLIAQGYVSDAHEAALANDWERFTALTNADASSVNRGHPIGGTTMYAAAAGGAGAEIWRVYAVLGLPNAVAPDGGGATPLQAALRYRDLETAEITAATLLGNDADPNPANRADDPPLHIAAERGSAELVEMLIRRGADVAATNRDGLTPGAAAERAGHRAVATMLARHRQIPRTHSSSRTAYDVNGSRYMPPDVTDIPFVERRAFVGQSHGNLDFVTTEATAEPRLVHSVATTSEICVEAGAHTGRKAVVEFLLEHGAPYSLPTAVMRNDRRRVEQLLDEDPERVHERGAHDFALLWYPVIGECPPDMMELLLSRGAEVEQQHYLGTTALHWACQRGQIDTVALLIEHGADVNRRGRKFDPAGATPLESARASGEDDVARLLIQRGAKTQTELR